MLSEKEFIEHIQANQNIIHKVCHLYMDSEADREDLFQEIVLSAWIGNRRYKGEAKFSTWLYKVALNTAISFFKKQKKRPTLLGQVEAMVSIIDPGYRDDEHMVAMNKAIGELSAIDKALILLYIEDYSHQDIAAVMGISVNNVAVKINRIKAKLKEASKKYL